MDGVNDALFNAAPNVQQAMTQNIAVMSYDVSRSQKTYLNQKVNASIKNTSNNTEIQLTFEIGY